MLVFPFVEISALINNHAEIRTKGNTNFENSLIRLSQNRIKRFLMLVFPYVRISVRKNKRTDKSPHVDPIFHIYRT